MKSLSDNVIRRIRAKRRGWVFTAKDFIDIASRNTVDQVLYRLLKQALIRKLDRGLYDFPVIHKQLGQLSPDPDKIAYALAAKSGDVVQPSAARVAHIFGLDTQVPAKPIYLTSGTSRKKQINKYSITLKRARLLSAAHQDSKAVMIIHALKHLGRQHIDDKTINKCKKILTNKDRKELTNMLKKVPGWMVPTIESLVGVHHGRVFETKSKRTN